MFASFQSVQILDAIENRLLFVGCHDHPIADLIEVAVATDAEAIVGVHLTDRNARRGNGGIEEPFAHTPPALGTPTLPVAGQHVRVTHIGAGVFHGNAIFLSSK